MAALRRIGLDASGLSGLKKIKIGTVVFAAGMAKRDSGVWLFENGEDFFGHVISLLATADNRQCYATVSLCKLAGGTFAQSLRVAPSVQLQKCLDDGLYGRQYIKCEEFAGRTVVAVKAVELMGQALFVKSSDGHLFVRKLPRHFVHD